MIEQQALSECVHAHQLALMQQRKWTTKSLMHFDKIFIGYKMYLFIYFN